MKKRAFALLAAVLVTQAAGSRSAVAQAQTEEKAARPLVMEQVLRVCDTALLAAMNGEDAKAVVVDAVKDIPAEQRETVLSICGVYIMGATAFVKHQAEADAKALKASAGERI